MSETHFIAKTPQLLPKQGILMSYPKLTLSPFSEALVLQFAHSPFYTFVALYLMVLYQLESLHLVDYNLINSQKKNRVFDKCLTTFPLETKHSPFYKHSSKRIQTNTKTHLQPIQNIFIHIWGFPQPKHKRKGVMV